MTDPDLAHSSTITIGHETLKFLRALGARMKLMNENETMMALPRADGQPGDELTFRVQLLREEPNGKETIPRSSLHP